MSPVFADTASFIALLNPVDLFMQEKRLCDALTTDQHFSQAGFRPLMKP
jgi:hypothetical protein